MPYFYYSARLADIAAVDNLCWPRRPLLVPRETAAQLFRNQPRGQRKIQPLRLSRSVCYEEQPEIRILGGKGRFSK